MGRAASGRNSTAHIQRARKKIFYNQEVNLDVKTFLTFTEGGQFSSGRMSAIFAIPI